MLNLTVKAYSLICFGVLLFLVPACTAYKPLPLDEAAITRTLTLRNMEAVRLQAKEIRHPILKPIEFDIRNGLSADEAAILAVIANPKLRATRDQRQLAAAQLFQAGVLPNPQLAYGVHYPLPYGGIPSTALPQAHGGPGARTAASGAIAPTRSCPLRNQSARGLTLPWSRRYGVGDGAGHESWMF